MSSTAGSEVDSAAELGVACLVNGGRWEDVEPFIAQYPASAWTADMSVGIAVARIRTGRWDAAVEGLTKACDEFPHHDRLRTLTLRALMSWAADRMQARDWPRVAAALGEVLKREPAHAMALQMQSSLRGATPMARLLAGERAETAAAWEEEFVRDRKTETAHHLAILYYWWAVEENSGDIARAASLWQRSIGCWVYVLHDSDYWSAWVARKRPAYEPDIEAVAGLQAAVRKDIDGRIAALSEASTAEDARYVEDLAMDCWAEFEVAALLRRTGVHPTYGPLLMDLLGCPEYPSSPASPVTEVSIRLGDCELSFVSNLNELFELYRAGLVRSLAYLANGRFERAEMLVRRRLRADAEHGKPRPIVGEMLAFVRMRQAEAEYVRLKCPPEESSYESVRDYASAIRKLIDSVAEVHGYVVTETTGQALLRLVALLCRRTYNEFTSFESGSADRVRFLEDGVDLLDRCLRLANGIRDVEEARLYLAAMVNRLALQVDKDAHDRIIDLLERATQLAPDNPNYRRNLAFSYFNRYATRKRRDLDMAGARSDIQKAYQLAPYDADIRAEYQQMHGWGRV